MPRASHGVSLVRQWELLKLLPTRQPGKTAAELCSALGAAGHDVSKRTVERDLIELTPLFPIASNEHSKPYGWYLLPGARLEIPGIDLAEAVSLGLLENLLRQLIPHGFMEALEGRFTEAREKLQALPRNPYAKWTDLVRYIPPGLPFRPPVIAPDVLRAVQDALLQQRQLKVDYLSGGTSASKELVLHPVSLIQQGERSYLLAGTFDYVKPVYYAIHRMQTAEVLAETSKRPPSFSLDKFLARGGAQFGEGQDIALKAHLTDHLAAILRETPISPDQSITIRKGQHMLSATVKDSWQLQFWILSQGPSITIRQPAQLRKRVVALLNETLAGYPAK